MGLINFIKTVWNNGGPPGISAQQLNRIENGIKALDDLTTATAQPNKILALNSQSKLPASITGDAQTLQTKTPNDFQNSNKAYGEVHYTDSLNASSTVTKTINLGNAYKFGMVSAVIKKGTTIDWRTSVLTFITTDSLKTRVLGTFSDANTWFASWTRQDSTITTSATTGLGRNLGNGVRINDIYINGNNLVITFQNTETSAKEINYQLNWEVW